ncbi:MAG: radical SAM protein [Parcubacteria group bacterium]|nr:radical SAM protein [Parcubacteria group bacterium]
MKFVAPAFIDRTKFFKKIKALLRHKNPLKFAYYRYEWNSAPKWEEVRDFPVHLGIEPTNACNLSCVFCARHAAKYSEFGFLDFELYKKIIDEGSKHNLRSVKLARGGESLMHPRFADMIAYAKEKGVVDVLFNTNAMLLSTEKALEIIKAKPDTVIFSVDAPDKKIYESQRVGSNYEEVERNVKNFIEMKNKLYPKIVTRAHMVYTKETEYLVPVHLKRWEGITEEVSVIPALSHTEELSNLKFKCRTPFRRMDITWNGNVYVCDPDYDTRGKLLLGNANDKTIHEIWHSEQMNKLREAFKKESPNSIDPCKFCRGA